MKIMDCTLRDGANVVGNGFSPELTRMMIEGLLRSNIRIIEMGNAKGLGATEKGSPAPISDAAYLDLIHPYLDRAEIGMFLNAKRFEADNVAMAADKGISFLRLGADAGDGASTYEKAAIIKKHGIKVRYSLMKAYLLTPEELAEEADVIFTATPQGLCASLVNEEILSKTKIIDLSADFRIKDVNIYEQWYKIGHPTPQFIPEAVYGLPEINREAVKGARLIANPGCYPTCSFLSIYPLLKAGLIDPDTIIIDAKSGTSGAGRGAKTDNLYCEVNESIKAYGVASHRHTPEIEEQLSYVAGRPVTISFTPHLVPMDRGILVTAYASLTRDVGDEGGAGRL